MYKKLQASTEMNQYRNLKYDILGDSMIWLKFNVKYTKIKTFWRINC